jgi:hypothetical protein
MFEHFRNENVFTAMDVIIYPFVISGHEIDVERSDITGLQFRYMILITLKDPHLPPDVYNTPYYIIDI